MVYKKPYYVTLDYSIDQKEIIISNKKMKSDNSREKKATCSCLNKKNPQHRHTNTMK